MLNRIMVGYAGDRAGRDAVTLAGVIAAAVQGRLSVVFPYHPLLARADAEEVQRRIAVEVRALLDTALLDTALLDRALLDTALLDTAGGAETLPEPAFHWTSSPWPIHALHELARYEESDLLVFGAAREGLGDRLHVSLMERMVHGAPCAVAVAPDGYGADIAAPGEIPPATGRTVGASAAVEPEGPGGARRHELRRIGVGFSSSQEGHAAVDIARELAGRSGGRVRAIAAAGLEPALASYAFSSPALVDIEEDLYRDTEETLERFCSELQDGTPVEQEIVRGDPASVLIERSSQLDLLVLGSRAYGPVRHVLLGSVSARVMREARCPVLVVPRGVARSDERDHEQRAGAAHQG